MMVQIRPAEKIREARVGAQRIVPSKSGEVIKITSRAPLAH
jgi:hypothetical protein